MAGKRIGDHQVGIYKKLRTKLGQEVAAAKTGISVRSARRIDASEALPSQREARSWRTRADPFEAVWESELVPMLTAAPALTATTLLEEIQRRYPGQYDDALLRTLQRRVRTWSASYGAEREVFFAQAHSPGRLGLSDFTHAAVLQVTIAGATLLHLLYQFALAYSGWRYVEVVLGGESFMALSSGLQNAVWMMGGVPEEHRTDSLAAAYNNKAEQELLTRRYNALCQHYGMRPSRNNLGVSHENGSIESRQGTLKRTMEQALLLRGHRDFADLDAYRLFVAEVFGRLNGRVARKFNEERATASSAGKAQQRLRGSRRARHQVLHDDGEKGAVHRSIKTGWTSTEGACVRRAAGVLARQCVRAGVAARPARSGQRAGQSRRLPPPAPSAQTQARRPGALSAAGRAVPTHRVPPDVGSVERLPARGAGLQAHGRPAGPGGQRWLRGGTRAALGLAARCR